MIQHPAPRQCKTSSNLREKQHLSLAPCHVVKDYDLQVVVCALDFRACGVVAWERVRVHVYCLSVALVLKQQTHFIVGDDLKV